MAAVIKKCTIADLESAPNIADLLVEYAAESSIDGLPKPSAKVDMYKHLESLGTLSTFGAFINDALIGYITVLSPIMPHYSTIIAVAESFFVAKEYRKTGAGLKLLHEAESHARAVGSPGLLVSAPFGGNLAEVLPHIGYNETNRVFFKSLHNV
jgi:GNAT superfamily N-acetyltransferase